MNTLKTFKYLAIVSSALIIAACSDDNNKGPEMNQAPVASKLSIMTVTDTPVMDELQADDPDGDALNFILINDPKFGTVKLSNDGSFTYTPDNEFTGADVFTFIATDGKSNSATTEVDITVNVKQEVFSSYSREAYQKQSGDEASGVNGRDFIFDVTTTDTYQDLVQDGEQ